MEKINPTEEQIQIAVMDWARLHPICKDYLIYNVNSGDRHISYAKKLKRMGQRKGVSDLLLAYPCNGYHAAWIELKSKTGVLTIEQKEWINRMIEVGCKAYVVRSIDDAIAAIKDYLGEL
jgi:VRR-NUC domain-containing protein